MQMRHKGVRASFYDRRFQVTRRGLQLTGAETAGNSLDGVGQTSSQINVALVPGGLNLGLRAGVIGLELQQ